ncbi:hypothetical protein [Streptomyces sp. NPDC091215]|uniref:hypothetical protein n=1 Tax=Streptomyces sp. NPDC091215 TaxID=3155192 RepID=UPI00342D024E
MIEDDHFSAVSARPYHRITTPATARWALVRSVSKFLGPDLRLALIATDAESATRLEARLSAGTTWVSHLLQRTAHELLVDPGVQELDERAREAYAHRSGLLIQRLHVHGIEVSCRPDGLHVWIELVIDSGSVVQALVERGWAVRPGHIFLRAPSSRRPTHSPPNSPRSSPT